MPIRGLSANPCGGGLDRTVRESTRSAWHLAGSAWRLLRSQELLLRNAHQGMHRAVGPYNLGDAGRLPQLSRDVFRGAQHLTTSTKRAATAKP